MRRIKALEERIEALEEENRDLAHRLETYSDIVLDINHKFSEELEKTIDCYVRNKVIVQSVCNMEAYNKGQEIRKILEENEEDVRS